MPIYNAGGHQFNTFDLGSSDELAISLLETDGWLARESGAARAQWRGAYQRARMMRNHGHPKTRWIVSIEGYAVEYHLGVRRLPA